MAQAAHASCQTGMALTIRTHRDCGPRWGRLTHLRRTCHASAMRDERSLDEKLAPQDFVGDFIWAARAVFSQPSVALLSIALWCIPVAISFLTDSRTALACLACWFVTFGWYGAERVFFLCKRDGKEVSLGDLLWCAPHFGGRFF